MKRIVSIILCSVLLFLSAFPAYAVTADMQTEQNEDGSYFVITNEPLSSALPVPGTPGETEKHEMNVILALFKNLITKLMRLFYQMAGQKNITKAKYIYYYSSDSTLLWQGKLSGEFVYSNSSAKCIRADFDFESYDSNWELKDHTCTAASDSATVTFYVAHHSLGVKLQTIEKTVTLSCDTNGNVT